MTENKTRSNRADNKAKYDKSNTKGLYIKLNKKTDSDIIEALAKCSNKQGLIKALLRVNGYGDRAKAPGATEMLEAERRARDV